MGTSKQLFRRGCLAAAVSASTLTFPGTHAQEGGGVLEEIIVTASRRTESIQDSSLIVQALAGDALGERGITNMFDLGQAIPSLQVGAAGPALQMYIRGVGNATSTGFGSPAIAVSKDGVYIPRATAVGANFYDLQRVEVLKGPQGTLYGRNATGGVVNLITNGAELGETSGYVAADIGDYEKVQLEGAINIPMGETFAARASVFAIDRDGYMSDDTGDDEHWSGRIQTTWAPTDTITWRFQGQYAEYEGAGPGFTWAGSPDAWDGLYPGANAILEENAEANGLVLPDIIWPWIETAPVVRPAPTPPFPPGTNFISLVNYIEDDIEQDMEFWDISTTLDWDLGFATLTAIAGYQDSEVYYISRPSVRLAVANRLDGDAPETAESYSFEARLAGQTETIDWVIGFNVFNEEQEINNAVNQGVVQNLQIVTDYETDAIGVFGDIKYSLNDRWRLLAGLRYSDDEQEKSNFSRYAVDESVQCNPDGPTAEIFNGLVACRISGPETEDLTSDNIDWKAGVEYDLSDDSMVFFTVSTGYKAGGIPAVSGITFDEEELTAYSLGMKNILMDGRLQLNGDIFYWDYEGRQENVVGPDAQGIIGLSTFNAGDTTIQGAAVEIQFAATERDILTLNVEYLDTEYDDFTYLQAEAFTPPTTCDTMETGNLVPTPPGPSPELLIDCSGFETTKSPEWSVFAEYIHTFSLGDLGTLDAQVNVSYTDEQWLSANFLPQQRVEDYTIWNAYLAYRSEEWPFTAIAYYENFTEEESYHVSLNHTQVPELVGLQPGAPRTYGVRLRYEF